METLTPGLSTDLERRRNPHSNLDFHEFYLL